MNKRILISPKAYVLKGSVDSVKEKNSDVFAQATSGYDYSFQYSQWMGGGRALVAHDECARHSKISAGNLILSPFGKENSIVIETGIDPLLLRSALLYWDSIDLPIASCGTEFVSRDNDIELLEKESILSRYKVNLKNEGLSLADVFYGLYLDTQTYSRENHFLQPTTLGQNIYASQEFWNHKTSDFILNLYKALPVPSIDVSLEKILNFKKQRSVEFERFKECMDSFESAIMSENTETRFTEQFKHLKSILQDIDKLMEESRIKRLMTTRTVALRLPSQETILSTAIGSLVGLSADLVTTGGIGIISLATSSVLSFFSFPHTKKAKLSIDYRYLMDISEQFELSGSKI